MRTPCHSLLQSHVVLTDSRSALCSLHHHSLQGDFIWGRGKLIKASVPAAQAHVCSRAFALHAYIICMEGCVAECVWRRRQERRVTTLGNVLGESYIQNWQLQLAQFSPVNSCDQEALSQSWRAGKGLFEQSNWGFWNSTTVALPLNNIDLVTLTLEKDCQ